MIEEKLLTDGSPSTEAVKNRDGSERLAFRARSGMFSKRPPAPTREEAQEALVTKLTEVDAEGSSVLERILDNQIAAASTSADQPLCDKFGHPVLVDGKPLLLTDPKVMMASAKAAQVVLRSAGLEQPIKEPVQQNRVEIVIIQPPDNMMNHEVVEDKPHPPLVPKFAEVTEIHTNPAEDLSVPAKPVKPAPRTQPIKRELISVEWVAAQNQGKLLEVSKGVIAQT